MTPPVLPLARTDQLLIVEVDDETLVYDLRSHRAHCLNRISAIVWRMCDGRTSVEGIVAAAASATGTAPDADLVWYALRRLNGARLVEGLRPSADTRVVSRRELMRRATAAGLGVMILPTVASVNAPTTLQPGATCLPAGSPCIPGVTPPCCATLSCKNEPGPNPGRVCR